VNTHTPEQLKEILRLHAMWLRSEEGGAHANLDGASLDGASLVGARLDGASLDGASLVGARLNNARLNNASLDGASLVGASLVGASLVGASLPYSVPTVKHIDAAILAAINKDGCALNMSAWHSCDTTHCRAGWAVVLAGERGMQMDAMIGTAAAGTLIYAASRPNDPIPDFYASNEDALDDIKKHAELDPIPAEVAP